MRQCDSVAMRIVHALTSAEPLCSCQADRLQEQQIRLQAAQSADCHANTRPLASLESEPGADDPAAGDDAAGAPEFELLEALLASLAAVPAGTSAFELLLDIYDCKKHASYSRHLNGEVAPRTVEK